MDGRDKPGHDDVGSNRRMKQFRTLDDVDVKGKRVLLRVDLNVPMENGRITDATRLERVAPTAGCKTRRCRSANNGRPGSFP